MGIVVAVKKEGIVYLCSDTWRGCSLLDGNQLIESNLSIKKLENGVIVGSSGSEEMVQKVLYNPRMLNILNCENITKEYLLRNFIPRMIDVLDEAGLYSQSKETLDLLKINLIVAQGGKAFYINQAFQVLEIQKYVAIGTAREFCYSDLVNLDYSKDINEQLLNAMKLSSKYSASVCDPYCFINTKSLEFEFKE